MTSAAATATPGPGRWRAGAWVVALAFRADRVRATLALIPLAPFCFGALAVAGRLLVDGVVTHDAAKVQTAAVVAGFGLFAGFASTYLQFAGTMLRLREAASLEVDRQLLELTAAIPTVNHFDSAEFADRVELLRAGKGPLTMTGGLITQVVYAVVSLLISAGLLASVHPALALIAIAAVPLGWWYRRTQYAVNAAEKATAEPRRTALHLFDVGTGLVEGKELHVSGVQQIVVARYRDTWRAVDQTLNRAALGAMIRRCVGWVICCAPLAVGLVVVVDLGVHHHITPGAAFLALGVILGLADQGSNLANTAAQVEATLALAVHFVTLRDTAAGFVRRSASDPQPAPDRIHTGVDIDDVGFAYPQADAPALHHVHLHLPAGTAVALVGENGAGKSTLVKLLAGLYTPTEGRILIDGIALSSLPPADWFARTSIVCQDYTRFELAVRESVGVGHLPDIDDPDAVTGAIEHAEADPIVARMPNGLGTQLGSRFGGTDLSGGEWQRITVARSMMRRHPLLLMLDEPTVSLDAITERALFDRLVGDARGLAAGHGTIVVLVSHRYATVRAADLIIVFDHGQVVEQGSHHQLLALGGRYAQAYLAQADAYR